MMAAEWLARGFGCFEFAASGADDGMVAETAALRQALGPTAGIACDIHRAHSAE